MGEDVGSPLYVCLAVVLKLQGMYLHGCLEPFNEKNHKCSKEFEDENFSADSKPHCSTDHYKSLYFSPNPHPHPLLFFSPSHSPVRSEVAFLIRQAHPLILEYKVLTGFSLSSSWQGETGPRGSKGEVCGIRPLHCNLIPAPIQDALNTTTSNSTTTRQAEKQCIDPLFKLYLPKGALCI